MLILPSTSLMWWHDSVKYAEDYINKPKCRCDKVAYHPQNGQTRTEMSGKSHIMFHLPNPSSRSLQGRQAGNTFCRISDFRVFENPCVSECLKFAWLKPFYLKKFSPRGNRLKNRWSCVRSRENMSKDELTALNLVKICSDVLVCNTSSEVSPEEVQSGFISLDLHTEVWFCFYANESPQSRVTCEHLCKCEDNWNWRDPTSCLTRHLCGPLNWEIALPVSTLHHVWVYGGKWSGRKSAVINVTPPGVAFRFMYEGTKWSLVSRWWDGSQASVLGASWSFTLRSVCVLKATTNNQHSLFCI